MKKPFLSLLLALGALACNDPEPEVDPRCVDLCEVASEECNREDGRQCEATCQASIDGFSPEYAACVLDRADIDWRETRSGAGACDFAIDDRDACTSDE